MKRISPAVLTACLLLIFAGGCGRADREEVLIKPDGESHPAYAVDVPFATAPEENEPAGESAEAESTVEGTENEESTGKAGSIGQKDPAVIAPEDPGDTVYLILPSAEGPSLDERDIITAACRNAGVGIVVLNYENDPIAEAEAFDIAIRDGADMILCDNADETLTARASEKAMKAGIPVILLGRGLDTFGIVSYQVLTESYSSVRKMGEEYADFTEGNASYVLLLGEGTAADLGEAFESVMSSFPGIRYLGSAYAPETGSMEAYDAVWQLLKDQPEADTVVVYNTVHVHAALDAAADLDRDVSVLCLSGDTDEVTHMAENGTIHSAVVKPAAGIAEHAGEQIGPYFLEGELPAAECYYVQGLLVTEGEKDE